jgi:hypothetical protein
MKTFPKIAGVISIAFILGLASPPVVRAVLAPALRVTVLFDHPEKFVDIRIWRNPVDEEKDRNIVLAMLRDYITQRAVAYLPEGDRFVIRFSDIRLAGQFPPGGYFDTRIVNRHLPPEFIFGWVVVNASGAVIKKGTVDLFDGAFMDLHSDYDGIDRFFYDKAVLDDWMRENLRM